jgi:general secretion pathway protein G
VAGIRLPFTGDFRAPRSQVHSQFSNFRKRMDLAMTTYHRRRNRAAFTLIELLLVLVILAVLASIVVINFTGVFHKTRNSKALADLHELGTALELYRVDCGDYPPTLEVLVTNSGARGWAGPYINHGLPIDPWDHAYVYVCPGQHHPQSYDLSVTGDGKSDVSKLNSWTADTPK